MSYSPHQLRGGDMCHDCCFEKLKKCEAVIEMMKKHEAEMSVS
jgi:hypothetical protein